MKALTAEEILTELGNPTNIKEKVDKEVVLSPKALQSHLKKRVSRLLKKKENKFCIDCSKKSPRWFTILSIPPPYTTKEVRSDVFQLGGFCCLECSGAHRRLGTHISFVRSIDLDSLREIDVVALENGGNDAVNKIFEGKLFDTTLGESCVSVAFSKKDSLKPDPNSTQKPRELFIRNKYEKKLYIDIKQLSLFRQSMLNQMRTGFSLGDVVSPTNKMKLDSPASSTKSITASPIQLQVFTSSPRTLAMIEKYMNPKPKRQNFARIIRNSLRRQGPRSSKKKYLQKSLGRLRGIVIVNPSVNIVETRSEEYGSDGDCDEEGDQDEDTQSVTSTRSSMSAFWRRGYVSDKKVRKYQQINNKSRSTSTPIIKVQKKRSIFRRKPKKGKRNNKNNEQTHCTEEELEVFQLRDENVPSTPISCTKSPRFRLTPYLRTPKRKNLRQEDSDTGVNDENETPITQRECKDETKRVSSDEKIERVVNIKDAEEEEESEQQEDIKSLKAWSAALDNVLIRMKRKCQKIGYGNKDKENCYFIDEVEEDEQSHWLRAKSM